MNLGNFVKKIQNIMRGDSGINGDAQRIEQLTWILFLKFYDAKEDEWEVYDDEYQSIIPENLRWKNWAIDNQDGKAFTGAELLDFVNNELFPTLKNLPVTNMTPKKKAIVREVFDEVNQYMKDGTLLRQIINVVNEIEVETTKDKNFFGD
ncbi:MAG: type I restriction-modification system subunit M N-terminal domain-containing protein, partial [Selenomonadaceae bacterium]|nr:type I restriction-modification system subunit M N-terminal domain-containing protein [Selenomonadaceae bacterium]